MAEKTEENFVDIASEKNKNEKPTDEKDDYRILVWTLRYLRVIGQWPPREEVWYKPIYHVFSVLMMTFIMMTFSISENTDFIMLIVKRGDLDKITNNLTHCVSHTLGVFKSFNFLLNRKRILRLLRTIESDKRMKYEVFGDFKPREIENYFQKINQYSLFTCTVLCSGVVFGGAGAPLFFKPDFYLSPLDNTTMHTNRPPLMSSWFPFDTTTVENYWLVFGIQAVGLSHHACMILSLDNVFVGFMCQLQAQCRIVQQALMTIRERCIQAVETRIGNLTLNRTEFEIGVEIEVHSELRKVVTHHQLIFELCKEVEDVFGGVLFAQFMAGVTILCVSLYQCSNRSPTTLDFYYMMIYLMTITFQLTMYCWFANEVTNESSKLLHSTWSSNWMSIIKRTGDPERDARLRDLSKSFMIIRERAKKPITFSAKGFAKVNLNTFTSVLNTSYSYFAFLKQMK